MAERKGLMTPEQEKLLDKLIPFKSKVGEAVDGPVIQVVDNQGIERLKGNLSPEVLEIVYQMIDIIFEGLAELDKPE